MIHVFTRNWYRRGPNGTVEPNPGARKRTLAYVETEQEARELCREYNATHKPGPLSKKAEYEA